MTVRELQDKIIQLKKETDTAILAHCYQAREIVEIADFTGDSYKLSVDATKTSAKISSSAAFTLWLKLLKCSHLKNECSSQTRTQDVLWLSRWTKSLSPR